MNIHDLADIAGRPNLILSGFILSIMFFVFTLIKTLGCNIKYKEKRKILIIFSIMVFYIYLSLGLKFLSLWFMLYTVICILIGKFFRIRILKLKEFNLIRLSMDFFLGFYFNAIVYFVVSHKNLVSVFGEGFNNKFLIAYLILIVLIAIFKRKELAINLEKEKNTLLENKNSVIIILVAVSLITAYFIVFNYNVVFSWSWIDDKRAHLSETFIREYFICEGFPLDKLYSFLFQLAVFVPTAFLEGDAARLLLMSYNFFGLLNLFFIFLIPYEFSKELHLSTKLCVLSSFLTVFYGPLGAPIINSYIGFINISGSMYHNTTQFFVIPLILICIYNLYKWVFNTKDYNNLILSVIFLNLSFFIKSSGYMILAPSMCILIGILFLTRKSVRNWSTVFSGSLIFIPAIFWIIYPKIFAVPKTTTNTIVGKFGEVYLSYINAGLKNLHMSIYAKIFMVIVFSLIGIILVSIFGKSKDKNVSKFYYKFMLPVFIVCILVACIFVEDGIRRLHGNFMWQTSLIGCALMPFIAAHLEEINNKTFNKFITYILYLNMFSGFWHLLLLNLYNSLN